jgi:hypothetical protein
MSTDTRTEEAESSAELARWLVEVGRRKWTRRAPEAPPLAAHAAQERSFCRLVLLGALASALFQYLYLDALLELTSLPRLIVFVLTGAHG